jgi:hypothetical protein
MMPLKPTHCRLIETDKKGRTPMSTKKNPYDSDTPEWQLWENWNSQDALIRAADDDVKRAEARRSAAITKRDQYERVLAKLGKSPT